VVGEKAGRGRLQQAAGGLNPRISDKSMIAPYCAVMPPSILNSEPVMNLDSSEAR
jgi:hypothetical protein